MGKIFLSPDDKDFDRLFLDFRYTAYRLETQQWYDVAYEKNEFSHFLKGEPRGEFPGISEWIEGVVSKAVTNGKLMRRVHVVEVPLTDYVRFECAWAYKHTVPAGEDVRIILTPKGEWPAELPHYDYWLFDSSQLLTMYYEEDGVLASVEVVDEPDRIVQANYWRDMAVGISVPYRDFAERYDAQFLANK